MTDKTTSVLASLTASVMDDKKIAARVLTPVAGEARRLPDVPGDFLTDEGVANVATECRRNAEYLLKVADGIDLMRNAAPPAVPVADLDAKRAEKERAADARAADVVPEATADFDARIAELATNAQAATFSWVCPDHGEAVVKTSAKGRAYRGCPDCNQFER